MSFFKKIGRGFKKAFEGIGDVADKVVDGISDVAEKVVDVAGDVTERVTRVVAGDKIADKVKSSFDTVEHVVGRTVKGIMSVSGIGLLGSLDDMAQKGFIDGLTSHIVDGSQDVIGATARLLGGEKAEKKFDKVFDEKIQSYIETGLSTAIRTGLIFVPGGQAVLLGDAVSEAGSLAYRAANDEKLGVMDYVGAGMAFIGVGGAGAVGAGAVSAGTKGATTTALKSTDDVLTSATKSSTNVLNETASSTAKNTVKNSTDDISKATVNSSDEVALTTKEKAQEIATSSANAMIEQGATTALTNFIIKNTQPSNAQPPNAQPQLQNSNIPQQSTQTNNTLINYDNNFDNSESFSQPLVYQNKSTFLPTTNWGF